MKQRRGKQESNFRQQAEESEEKISKIQKAHYIEIRNIKNLAIQYAIDYFKSKSEALNKIFN